MPLWTVYAGVVISGMDGPRNRNDLSVKVGFYLLVFWSQQYFTCGRCTYTYLPPFKYTFTLDLDRPFVNAFIAPSMNGRCRWKRRWEGAVPDFCQQEQISTFALQSFPVSSFHLFHFLSLLLLFPFFSAPFLLLFGRLSLITRRILNNKPSTTYH